MTSFPKDPLFRELANGLARSDAAQRKVWANRFINQRRSLASLFPLLHGDPKTVERFTWFIGDLSDLSPNCLTDTMPFLFELKDQLEFPGITRSVAKWLLRTGIPKNIESLAIPQLLNWVTSESASIGCKSYSAAALWELARQDRIRVTQAAAALKSQLSHSNRAYGKRIQKLLETLSNESGPK